MCGLVGLHLKNPALQPCLGELLTQMLEAMTTRGPDSAGIAFYADHPDHPDHPHHSDPPGHPHHPHHPPAIAGQDQNQDPYLRYSLRSDETIDWDLLAKRI